MARVVIENLTKIFQDPKSEKVCAVKNVNLIIEDKEFVVIVGPSGCGKTTLLRLLAGLEEVTDGTISLDGQLANTVPPKDRNIAMVFQNFALYPHLTVYENLAFSLRLQKQAAATITQRVRATAEMLGLASCLTRRPQALSGGERQRVALGRALVRQPAVFLLDEPLSNLDAPLREQMRAEILKLHARLGATMLYVTHDQGEAVALGQRLVVMNAGVIQQAAAPLQIYQRPANLFVAGFIGSPRMNLIKGLLIRRAYTLFFCAPCPEPDDAGGFTVKVCDQQTSQLTAYEGKPLILGLRPEDIALRPAGWSGDNGVIARVERLEPKYPEMYVSLRAGAHSVVARELASTLADANQRVTLAFDMDKAHFFDPVTELRIA